MSMWKDNTAVRQPSTPTPAPEPREVPRFDAPLRAADVPAKPTIAPAPRSESAPTRKESLIADDITIEGKIEGAGSVRIAGKFKGDVSVQGDVTIEVGAKLTGGVRADNVTIAGELEGNVEQATRVDLTSSGMVTGDLNAGSLTVAAGARMRGQTTFGWDERQGSKVVKHSSDSTAERSAGS